MKSLKKVLCAVLTTVLLISAVPAMADNITMYAPDGRTAAVEERVVQSWQRVGWYTYPVMYIYSVYNSFPIAKSDRKYWLEQGWYDYPVINVYSADGTVVPIAKSDLEDWKKEGWYEDYQEKVYAVNGYGHKKSETIWKTQENQWKSAGWRTDEPKVKYENYTCSTCNGHGFYTCSLCYGRGRLGINNDRICSSCNGNGRKFCSCGNGIRTTYYYYYD